MKLFGYDTCQRQQLTCYGSMWLITCVQVEECATTHGTFYITNIKTALTKHGGLLVANLQQLKDFTRELKKKK
jgi:hypothetical protein